jgi:hypothetical protein
MLLLKTWLQLAGWMTCKSHGVDSKTGRGGLTALQRRRWCQLVHPLSLVLAAALKACATGFWPLFAALALIQSSQGQRFKRCNETYTVVF